MGNVIDSIPVIGHIKGGVHYAMGDNEQCIGSMKAATRTTVVVIGGLAGHSVTGEQFGAMAGGVVGGLTADICITELDKSFNPNPTPYGYVAAWKSEDYLELAMTPALDGLIGYLAAVPCVCLVITTSEKGKHFNAEFRMFNGDHTQHPRVHYEKRTLP